MREEQIAFRILVGKPEIEVTSMTNIDGKMILRRILEK
jgi:hypothetical protein